MADADGSSMIRTYQANIMAEGNDSKSTNEHLDILSLVDVAKTGIASEDLYYLCGHSVDGTTECPVLQLMSGKDGVKTLTVSHIAGYPDTLSLEPLICDDLQRAMLKGSTLIVGLGRSRYDAEHFQSSDITDSQHTYIGILRKNYEEKHFFRPELGSLAEHLYNMPTAGGQSASLNGRQVTLILPKEYCGCNGGKDCPFGDKFDDEARKLFVEKVYEAAGGDLDGLEEGDETAEKDFDDLYNNIHLMTRKDYLGSSQGQLLKAYLSDNSHADQMHDAMTARGVPISAWWRNRNIQRERDAS